MSADQFFPMDAFFPKKGEPPRCRVLAPDISVHWYATPQAETCICGEVEQRRDGKRKAKGKTKGKGGQSS